MFIIEKRLGGCCNSCCKTINDNEESIMITSYLVNAIGRVDIMQISLCKDCYKELANEIKERGIK